MWLADGTNNNYECSDCRKSRPADFYVDMLNELDAALSANGLATRIVFLIYVDLLWLPLKRRLRNPDLEVFELMKVLKGYINDMERAGREPAAQGQ